MQTQKHTMHLFSFKDYTLTHTWHTHMGPYWLCWRVLSGSVCPHLHSSENYERERERVRQRWQKERVETWWKDSHTRVRVERERDRERERERKPTSSTIFFTKYDQQKVLFDGLSSNRSQQGWLGGFCILSTQVAQIGICFLFMGAYSTRKKNCHLHNQIPQPVYRTHF